MSAVIADAVARAISELEEDYVTDVVQTGDGGAFVTLHDVDIGPHWVPATVDIETLIPFNYPFAAIYPFYTSEALQRVDSGAWPNALQRVEWRARRVVQISLRANRWDPNVDTARGAIAQVELWFKVTP
jgi:Prokaryotic E2 family E